MHRRRPPLAVGVLETIHNARRTCRTTTWRVHAALVAWPSESPEAANGRWPRMHRSKSRLTGWRGACAKEGAEHRACATTVGCTSSSTAHLCAGRSCSVRVPRTCSHPARSETQPPLPSSSLRRRRSADRGAPRRPRPRRARRRRSGVLTDRTGAACGRRVVGHGATLWRRTQGVFRGGVH